LFLPDAPSIRAIRAWGTTRAIVRMQGVGLLGGSYLATS